MSLSRKPETEDSSPERKRVRVERAGSPVPSCLSMKSDASMGHPFNFRGEFTGDQRVRVERAGSPVPSCLSMKSDASMGHPFNFRGEFTGDQRVRVERAESPVPSFLSMKSNASMGHPFNFRGEFTGDQRSQWSLESSCLDEKSSDKLSFPKQSLLRPLHILRNMKQKDLPASLERDEQHTSGIGCPNLANTMTWSGSTKLTHYIWERCHC
ncbi:hypothetical protein SKAU_G00425220 [Synaphobranchus kaupii]|uniref:Uncharacterized protein n=1 Tax=Synaphobranchus kaupii TaxID=118154 RepID=A0A9Q1E5P9_SYNKA|nr:hypothetical protein SKAU_G00425220 [Synaphobranchus kaupii]